MAFVDLGPVLAADGQGVEYMLQKLKQEHSDRHLAEGGYKLTLRSGQSNSKNREAGIANHLGKTAGKQLEVALGVSRRVWPELKPIVEGVFRDPHASLQLRWGGSTPHQDSSAPGIERFNFPPPAPAATLSLNSRSPKSCPARAAPACPVSRMLGGRDGPLP